MQLSNSNLPERGTRPGPAPVGVVGSMDLPAAQADVEETRAAAAAQAGGDLLLDDGPRLAFPSVELGGQIVKLPLGLADFGLPGPGTR
jgi:nitrogen fixation protein